MINVEEYVITTSGHPVKNPESWVVGLAQQIWSQDKIDEFDFVIDALRNDTLDKIPPIGSPERQVAIAQFKQQEKERILPSNNG
jgi:hypothetical protein